METKTTESWYTANGSGGQGIIIDSTDGRTVAVAYDEKDAPLIASAPELLEALEAVEKHYLELSLVKRVFNAELYETVRAAITRAKGGNS